jgi:hypothetical protein
MNERRFKIAAPVLLLIALILGGSTVEYPGVMPAGIPQLSSETQRTADRATLNTEMRVGKVVSYNTAFISVLIGGSVIPNCAYGRSYQPVLGDYVIIIHQGSQWFVVDSLANNPVNNGITNATFEADTVGGAPSGWGKVSSLIGFTSSTLAVNTAPGSQHINGKNALNLTWIPGGVGLGEVDDDIYSPPIPVVPGEHWAASAYALLDGAFPNHPYAVQVGILMSWYNSSTAVYPSTSAPDSGITFDNISLSPAWYRIGSQLSDPDGITVPAGVSFMRVLLTTTSYLDASEPPLNCLSWDLPIATKIRNADGTYAP